MQTETASERRRSIYKAYNVTYFHRLLNSCCVGSIVSIVQFRILLMLFSNVKYISALGTCSGFQVSKFERVVYKYCGK